MPDAKTKSKDLSPKIQMQSEPRQASVERWFSVNKELVVENQSEQTLAARRIIKDHIIHVNGVTNVEITRNMVLAARSARAKYANYLAQQKEEQEVEKRNKKEKKKLMLYMN